MNHSSHCVLIFALTLCVLGLSPHAAAQTWGLGPPPRLTPSAAPGPELDGPEHARRAWLLGAFGEVQTKLCPAWAERCDTNSGLSSGVFALARPAPHFAWGPLLQWSQRREALELSGVHVDSDVSATALSLAGRVAFLESGALDPYIQVSAGLGNVQHTTRASDVAGSVVAASDQHWTPLYAASIGADWQLSDALRLGAHAAWTHWLSQPWERCPVALGICTAPTALSFDPNNAVLSAGLGLSVSLGPRL